jgi:hypothetical protein
MKRLTLSLVVSIAFIMCITPCAFPLSVGDSISGYSDILQVTMNGLLLVPPDTTNPQIRYVNEENGERVTEEIDFTIADTDAFNNFINDTKVYLVEPGATLNSNGTYDGYRSDTITFHISHDTGVGGTNPVTELHFTLNSDEDPGTHDPVTGYLENGLLQDITAGFGFGDLATRYGIVVLAGSDVETTNVPEPATLFFLGTGLLGLVGLRRKVKK